MTGAALARTAGSSQRVRSTKRRIDTQFAATRLLLRAKAVPEKGAELLTILRKMLLEAHLNNQERLKQLVLEEKASKDTP